MASMNLMEKKSQVHLWILNFDRVECRRCSSAASFSWWQPVPWRPAQTWEKNNKFNGWYMFWNQHVIFMFGSNWTNFVWSSLFFGMSLCFTGKCPFDKQYSNGNPPFAECVSYVSCFFQWKLRISPLPYPLVDKHYILISERKNIHLQTCDFVHRHFRLRFPLKLSPYFFQSWLFVAQKSFTRASSSFSADLLLSAGHSKSCEQLPPKRRMRSVATTVRFCGSRTCWRVQPAPGSGNLER